MQPPAFTPKPEPETPPDDWTALLAADPEEEDADEPAEEFAQQLPTPVPVSLFEDPPSPKKPLWPRLLLWGAVLAAITAGLCASWPLIG